MKNAVKPGFHIVEGAARLPAVDFCHLPSSIVPGLQAIISQWKHFLTVPQARDWSTVRLSYNREKFELVQLFPALTVASRLSNGTSNTCLLHRKKQFPLENHCMRCRDDERMTEWQKATAGNLTAPYDYMETRLYWMKAVIWNFANCKIEFCKLQNWILQIAK